MADRFENGDTRERPRRAAGRPARLRLRPDGARLLPRRRPQGPADADRLHPRPRHRLDLAHAELQEQGRPARGRPSAGYHGYWITDFTQIDPHLGTNADLRALVDAAHRRGMKVYFDIITNHTADVIGYAEGARRPYVSKDDEPYRDAAGNVFDDRDFAGTLASRRWTRRRASRTRRCSTRRGEPQGPGAGSTTSRSTTTAATRRSSARTRSTATSSASTTSSRSTRASCAG